MIGARLPARAAALERLTERRFDVLVIGGGITGAGVALDAATRGLSVALVERADFASGTSSKSSKLVHGGLRYLEQGEFALTREASVERDRLRRLAPHLVEPIPFVLPAPRPLARAKFGAGLLVYDLLASFRNFALHRRISPDETAALFPALPRPLPGFVYYDGRTDDVRLVMEVLLAACARGAVVANYCPVVAFDCGEEGVEAAVEDALSGERFVVAARRAVAAGGVWTDRIEALARPEAVPKLRPSKGVHLVFAKPDLPIGEAAALVPAIDRRRMLFVIPWHDAVLVGTTDTPFEGELDRPGVDEDDRAYVLDSLNEALATSLTEADIVGAFAGLRPLIAGRADDTADLSRRHAVYPVAPSMIAITGGKLTTYRAMAEEAVDLVVESLGSKVRARTRAVQLGSSNLGALRRLVEPRLRALGLPPGSGGDLIRRYGERALDVLELAAASGLTGPLTEGHAPLAAEALYCARAEMVVHLNDLLARRTRLALIDRQAGVGEGSVAAELLAGELGWSSPQQAAQVAAYLEAVMAERGIPAGGSDEPDASTAETG